MLIYIPTVHGVLDEFPPVLSPKTDWTYVLKKAQLEHFFKKVARGGERTRVHLISFISHFHHFTAEPQRLPNTQIEQL
jgi:hypothetical protein